VKGECDALAAHVNPVRAFAKELNAEAAAISK
jgi:hypothetical protein